MTKRPKWQEDPVEKNSQTRKDPNDMKTPKAKRLKFYQDTSDKLVWQEWVTERLTDVMLTDGHPPISCLF